MKNLRVFMNGEPLRNIYPHATRWQVFKYKVMNVTMRTVKWTIGLSVGTAVMVGFFSAGQMLQPKSVHAEPEQVIAPVLARIAQAESHNSQYCTDELIKAKLCVKSEKGQVLLNTNTDGSVDIGKYQINLYHWGAVASAKGLNLFNEQDNETFALYLYANYGTEPWNSSKVNWKK